MIDISYLKSTYLQGYVAFQERVPVSRLKKWLPRATFLPVDPPDAYIKYLKKEGIWAQQGLVPKKKTAAATKTSQLKFQQAVALATRGKMDNISPQLRTM